VDSPALLAVSDVKLVKFAYLRKMIEKQLCIAIFIDVRWFAGIHKDATLVASGDGFFLSRSKLLSV